ncbi:1-phosphofructokinase [Candidatus Enterococcus ferrettii]|uniref:Tagatose-6-phosphate kinase n=1 Tax=Candidatus Enterococcus ferrettii TaxID=2815324 RepID=A0ABV0ETY4_9ENTE|nr:1-phosphofructokinase [Enterococcus sp. 665A]MBO1341187.1 1-phosphofructokinase [Enterococcus sp. 665A]
MVNVYTCTMNLAIDLYIETEQLIPKVVNRTIDDDIQANGKGVNVSLLLKMLGIPNTALGFSGGFTGEYIEQFLNKQDIQTDFVTVEGITRINVFTQVNSEQTEYKLVNKGPEIDSPSIDALLQQICQFKSGDYLCVSGSLPRGVSPSILIEISKICFENKVNLIIDSSYTEILACLPYKPFLLKPNEDELAEWFGKERLKENEYVTYGKKLIAAGAKNVLLSLGSEGAIFINQEHCLRGNSPKGKLVNSACAGDTLLGTFLAGLIKENDPAETLRTSIAAGSSTAFRKGLTDLSDVAELEKQITIE